MITGIPNVNYLKCNAFDPNTGTEYGMYLQGGGIKNLSKLTKGLRLYLTISFLTI